MSNNRQSLAATGAALQSDLHVSVRLEHARLTMDRSRAVATARACTQATRHSAMLVHLVTCMHRASDGRHVFPTPAEKSKCRRSFQKSRSRFLGDFDASPCTCFCMMANASFSANTAASKPLNQADDNAGETLRCYRVRRLRRPGEF